MRRGSDDDDDDDDDDRSLPSSAEVKNARICDSPPPHALMYLRSTEHKYECGSASLSHVLIYQ